MSALLHLQLRAKGQQRGRINVSTDPIIDGEQTLPFTCGAKRRGEEDAVAIEETTALAHLKIGDADGLRARAQIELEAQRLANLKWQTGDLRRRGIARAWRRCWSWRRPR